MPAAGDRGGAPGIPRGVDDHEGGAKEVEGEANSVVGVVRRLGLRAAEKRKGALEAPSQATGTKRTQGRRARIMRSPAAEPMEAGKYAFARSHLLHSTAPNFPPSYVCSKKLHGVEDNLQLRASYCLGSYTNPVVLAYHALSPAFWPFLLPSFDASAVPSPQESTPGKSAPSRAYRRPGPTSAPNIRLDMYFDCT